MHLVLGHLQIARAHVLVRVELDLLEAHHLRGHVHLAVDPPRSPSGFFLEAVEDLHLRVGDGVGVVVDLGLAHVDPALLVVVLLHVVRPAFEDVDGFLVDHGGGRVVVDLGDDARLAGDVLHHEVVRGHAAQAHRVGGIALARPVPASARAVQQLLALEEGQDLREVFLAEALVVGEGQLEGRALHVGEQDVQVLGVDAALLGGAAEEVVGVLRDELVEGRRVGHQHRYRRAAAPARAPSLLPGRSHAAGITEEHGRVEAADVDAQLEGVRGDDAEHRALAQPALDLAALQGQIAAAVAADDALRSRPRLEGFFQIGHQDLGGQARGREHDGLHALGQERQGHVAGAVQGRLADAELPVHHRRVVDREVLLAPRRAASVDERHLAARHPLGQLLGVADGGRAAEELRVGPVEAAEPLQPPEDVGHVRAVDPAVAVDLVHDHVAQVLEQLHPLGVVGQDALVEHVGVRDHDVGASPDRLARVLRRVAVISKGTDVGPQGLDRRVELGELVLGQRLGGKEVKSPGVGVLQDPIEDGQVVAERLAGGRRGDDHAALPRQGRIVGLALVGVEALVAPLLEHLDQPRMQAFRKLGVLGRLGRVVAEGGQDRLGRNRSLKLQALEGLEQRALGPIRPDDELLRQAPSPAGPIRRGSPGRLRMMLEGAARGGPDQAKGLRTGIPW